MSRTARIPAAEVSGITGSLAKMASRKMLGKIPDSLGVMWHSRRVMLQLQAISRKAQKWNRAAPELKAYAHMAVAAFVGCSFCLDYGYFEAYHDGLDPAKASQVPRWRESTVFTPLEREVMAYAEAMSMTPPQVTDEMVASLHEQIGAPAVLELSAWIGFANLVTRTNIALGIESEGFSDTCEVPLAEPSPRPVTTSA